MHVTEISAYLCDLSQEQASSRDEKEVAFAACITPPLFECEEREVHLISRPRVEDVVERQEFSPFQVQRRRRHLRQRARILFARGLKYCVANLE